MWRTRRLMCLMSRQRLCFHRRSSLSTFVSKHYELSKTEVSEYLERKKLAFRVQGNGQINAKECPFCKPHKGRADNMWKLYLRQSDGAYFCHRCGTKGSWFDFKRHHGDLPAVESSSSNSRLETKQVKLPNQDEPVMWSENLLRHNRHPEAYKYLTETRGIEPDVLRKYGVGACSQKFRDDEKEGVWNDHECVVFPWIVRKGNDAITVRTKMRSLKQKQKQRLSPSGGAWGYFGWHTIPENAKEIVITEGEYDAMAVYQATGMPTISLPNGCRSLPVDLLPHLESFERIVLWMDADEPGQEGAQQFSQKLGRKRCVSVQPTNSMKSTHGGIPKDANDALLRGDDMTRLVLDAEPFRHNEIITFSDLREDVRREVLCPPHVSGPHFKSLPTFQTTMKGFRKGELSVYTGPTGSGKTTLLSQLSLDLCEQGINTLWGSFEIKNERILKKMLFQHARTDLSEGVENAQHQSEEDTVRELVRRQERFEAAAEDFESLPMYFMKFFGSTKVDEVLDAMDYAAYAYDVQHIILDNLQFMLSGQTSSSGNGYERFASQESAIEQFRHFATARNVHISLVMHPRKEPDDQKLGLSSIFGSAKATQEADNVIILQKVETEDGGGHAKKFLDVRKNRYDGELSSTQLFFNSGAQLFYEAEKSPKKRRRNVGQKSLSEKIMDDGDEESVVVDVTEEEMEEEVAAGDNNSGILMF